MSDANGLLPEPKSEAGYDAAAERRMLLPFLAWGAAIVLVFLFGCVSVALYWSLTFVPGPGR